MARKQKLKVYRTPIGFLNAYVAASSQKAAPGGWGADVYLFVRGIAETSAEIREQEKAPQLGSREFERRHQEDVENPVAGNAKAHASYSVSLESRRA